MNSNPRKVMAKTSDDLISVCMPVYNGRTYIAESIESVLSQTYRNFRLIICDNCSTDDTDQIVKRFNDSRIRYIRNEKNLGLVGNHQRCIELAAAKYVNIWHDDDIMMPDNLEKKIEILEKNAEVGLVFSNVELIDENGKEYKYRWNDECRNDFVANGKDLFKRYLNYMPIGALFFIGAVVSRKDALLQAGGFKTEYSPLTCDSAVWLRMLLNVDAACLGKALVKYRLHQKATTSSYHGSHFLDEHLKVVNNVLDEHRDKVVDHMTVKEEVHEAFIRQALENGIRACGNDDFEGAMNLLAWSKTQADGIGFKKDYWRLRLRLYAGRRGLRLFRSIKEKLKEAH